MHEFILGFFKFLRNVFYFLKIVAVFFIFIVLLYWVQNLTGGDWKWLDSMEPALKSFLKFANSIYAFSFDLFGVKFELKYINAVILLILTGILMEILTYGVNIIEDLYKGGRFIVKKAEEAAFNKNLQNDIKQKQKSLNKYLIVVNTYEKPKSKYSRIDVNLDEQNSVMNKFIIENTQVMPTPYGSGFLYCFDNFEKVDKVLNVLFRVINSKAPIDYAICVQVSTGSHKKDMELLDRLIKLKYLGKIYMGSDTAYRYGYNELHTYDTNQIGLFQSGDGDTMEVHEFKNNL